MNHGSLFSGIGGFDLAAEWMGWNNIFHCEWIKSKQEVLKRNFPKSKSYGDIRERMDDGFPQELDKELIHGFGNAVIPDTAYEIFKAIETYNLNL